jgi:hypothetical protein
MWRCRGRKQRAGSPGTQETWVNIWILKSRCCAERTGVGRYRRRKQVAYVLVRRMGYRLKDVAGYLGRDATTIATMLSGMNERLAGDIQEKREIERLGKIVDS